MLYPIYDFSLSTLVCPSKTCPLTNAVHETLLWFKSFVLLVECKLLTGVVNIFKYILLVMSVNPDQFRVQSFPTAWLHYFTFPWISASYSVAMVGQHERQIAFFQLTAVTDASLDIFHSPQVLNVVFGKPTPC